MALGLILSSSDINVINETDPSGHPATRFTGGEYGAPTLNSTLANPLTFAGDYCRSYSATNVNECFGGYYPLSSVDGGLYTGSISTSKAYSMRAWVRFENANSFQAENLGGGLNFLGQTNAIATHGSAINSYVLGGYTLQFSGMKMDGAGVFSERRAVLSINRNAVSGTSAAATRAAFPAILCDGPNDFIIGGYTSDTWYRIRFDMIPAGDASVTLNAYTSSAGDVASGLEVWELVGTATTLASDAVYVDPSLPENGMGWYAWKDGSGTDGDTFRFDQFEILVEDI
jgi:hypothetical protein